ncbi:DUF3618 domain-containing protein [Streptomyces sp. NPDC059506]|uniref:DUF3618 domain-containing protein n=1 Tax=unclassified Streptomyces TaxID=2593676 RepID=UPI000CAD926B|nr:MULTISPECIES: DUF3618 domain-containing protein [unclassified Streptomyces]MCZ2523365.1 DUF3618 domain-containing protein [Streptomyces sp. HB2AG]PLW72412.1 hypothetical protein C0036_12735 [Streptomyces sp. DJ]QMV23275.1 DUF3618 domain-containing protein [Streptomyces sp. SCUT-3]
MSEGRTPAQIEADINRRRQELAATLDEIAVRVHPKTVAADVRVKVADAVDRTAGRAYVAANRVVSDVRGRMVTEDGEPRMDRIVPVAVALVVVVGLAGIAMNRRRR